MKNNLVKQIVNHASFGQGTIVDYSKGRITVAFGSDEKVFQYPAAFEKFLKFNDSKLQECALADLKKKKEAEALEQIAKKESLKPIGVALGPKKKKNAPVKKNLSGFKYKDWEMLYPDHVIIQKEGFMYQAHNESAEKLAEILDYELMTDIVGRVTTGGPDPSKIGFALENANCSYLIIEEEQIVDQYNAK